MKPSDLGTRQSAKEARFVVVLWLICCVYTVGYAALFAYKAQPNPLLLLEMPSWVFWGVIVPWTLCTSLRSGSRSGGCRTKTWAKSGAKRKRRLRRAARDDGLRAADRAFAAD